MIGSKISRGWMCVSRNHTPCIRYCSSSTNSSKSNRLGPSIKVFSTIGIISGGVIGCVWYSPTLQHKLKENLPFLRPTLSRFFPESGVTPNELDDVPPLTPLDDSSMRSTPTDREINANAPDTEVSPEISTRWEANKDAVPPSAERQVERKREAAAMKQAMIDVETEEANQNTSLEATISEMTGTLETLVQTTVELQKELTKSANEQVSQYKKAIDTSAELRSEDIDEQWNLFLDGERNKDVKRVKAEESHLAAVNIIDKLSATISEAKSNKVTRNNKSLHPAQKLVVSSKKELTKALLDAQKAQQSIQQYMFCKEQLDKARKQFQEELDILTPGDERKLGVSDDERKSIHLNHAYRRIRQMQSQLAHQSALEIQHIQVALDEQMRVNELANADHAKRLLDNQRAEFDVEKVKILADAELEHERHVVKELARQAAAHMTHLQDMLKTQQAELEQRCAGSLNAAIIDERLAFQAEMSGWLARVKGIEAAVEGRANDEKAARDAQVLWAACTALNSLLKVGREGDNLTWEQKIVPLGDYVNAILDAANRHIFVETVARSIPDRAYTSGVWNEENLVARFKRVKRRCRRVAMINDDNRTLFNYFLAYIQSFFIFPTVHANTPDRALDPDSLDTYSALAHADYWLKHRNLENALRFMNCLDGEARFIAKDWIEEARLLLEAKQATDVLMNYAAASGLNAIS